MPETKRPLKVFLCHAHADRDAVRGLYARLVKDNVDAWLDKEKLLPGQDWKLEIEKTVHESDVVVVCLSKQFNLEGFRQREVRWALDKAMEKPEGEIFVIPARLEECDTLKSLRKWHWVDLFEEGGYEMLMRALQVRANAIGVKLIGQQDSRKEAEAKKLESLAIQYELKGDFWNARKTWYEIKRIDPLFPRVDLKIRELEEEIAYERAKRETAEMRVRERLEREKAERQAVQLATLKKTFSEFFAAIRSNLPKVIPVLRLTGFAGIAVALFWVGSWAISRFFYLPKEITDFKDIPMVLVPAGEFIMGSDNGFSNEQPVHKVNLDAFYIDKYEVTNGHYRECMLDDKCDAPFDSLPGDTLTRENYPVVYVDWTMANDYCQWRGARPPTEAEWEKAARGTEGFTYPWGADMKIGYANYNASDTKPVDNYPNNTSPYGVYNLAGNVSEWVSDWYSLDYYQFVLDEGVKNPKGPQISPFSSSHNFYGRVFRGGSWRSESSSQVSTTYRSRANPDYYADDLGFRCAKDATP